MSRKRRPRGSSSARLSRDNLGLPDGDIGGDPSHLREVVAFIRRMKPKTIAAPYGEDRHPDHVAASRLLTRAAFLSGLTRYGAAGQKWRPDWVLYYFINDSAPPSFVVDVSATTKPSARRWRAIARSSTPAATGGTATRLTSPRFRQLIESRDAQFGALIGVDFAEGVIAREPIARPTLLK